MSREDNQLLHTVRTRILNATMVYLAIAAPVSVVMSLLRLLEQDWNNVYLVHLGGCMTFVLLGVFRKRLPYNFKAILVLTAFFLGGTHSLIAFGLVGSGVHLFLVFALGTTAFYGMKRGLIATTISLLSFGFVSYLAVTNRISYNFDIVAYSISTTGWMASMAAYILWVPPLVVAFSMMYRYLESAASGMAKSQQRFQMLLEQTGAYTWEVDEGGRFVYLDDSVRDILGYLPEDLVGHTCFSDLMPEVDREKYNAHARKISKTGQIIKDYKHRLVTKSGELVWISTTGIPIADDHGQVRGYWGMNVDITRSQRMEEMMVQSEKMLSVGGLAAGMAHEINNPLGGIVQSASVMKERLGRLDIPANIEAAAETGISLDDLKNYMEKRKIIQLVDRIHSSGMRAAEIIRNMLSFARKDEGQRSTHHLSELLDTCVELAAIDFDLKKSYDFKKIRIERMYDDGVPAIVCDASKIQQVVMNTLRNSAEAMWEDTRPHEKVITLRLSNEGDKVKMEITDNGPGMTEEVRKRMLEPFFTTKSPNRGTGLGTSVSYFIITEEHGGHMAVESTAGVGTTITILLPINAST